MNLIAGKQINKQAPSTNSSKKQRVRWTYLRSESCKRVGMCFTSSNLDKINGTTHGARVKNTFIKRRAKRAHGLKHESTQRLVAVETEY